MDAKTSSSLASREAEIDASTTSRSALLSTSATTRAVMHVVDERGRCLFHPHITLRKKAILGKMGGWKDVLPSCPECEREDSSQGLSLGGNSGVTGGPIGNGSGRNTGGGVAAPPPSQAAVGRREGGSQHETVYIGSVEGGGSDSDDFSSSDNDSSSEGSSSASQSSTEASNHAGNDGVEKDLASYKTGKNRWAVGKKWARQTEKLRKLNERVGEKIRAEVRLAKEDLAADAVTNDADFVLSYMLLPSGVSNPSSSSRPTQHHPRVLSEPAYSHSRPTNHLSTELKLSSSSHQRRPPAPPDNGGVMTHCPRAAQQRILDISERSAQQRMSEISERSAQQCKLDTSERSSGSSPSQVISQHQHPPQRRGGLGGTSAESSSSLARRGIRKMHYEQVLRRSRHDVGGGKSSSLRGSNDSNDYRYQLDESYHNDDYDGRIDRYGDDGKMKKIFDRERRRRPSPPQPSSPGKYRCKESRHHPERQEQERRNHIDRSPPQLRDGLERVRRTTNLERTSTSANVEVEPQQHPTRYKTKRHPATAEMIASVTSERSLIRREGGKKNRHGATAASMEEIESIRGAVPTVSPFASDVAAYQWDRVPGVAEGETRLRGAEHMVASFDSDIAAYQRDRVLPREDDQATRSQWYTDVLYDEKSHDDESSLEDDSQHAILAAVAYQWDRMPVLPADESLQSIRDECMPLTPTLQRDPCFQEETTLQKRSSWHGQESQKNNSKDDPTTSGVISGHDDSDSSPDFMSCQSKFEDSKSNASSALGLLSMDDLLQSIAKDAVLMSKRDISHTKSGSGDMDASMPPLDYSGSLYTSLEQSSPSLGKENTEGKIKDAPDPNRKICLPNIDKSALRFSKSSAEDGEKNMKSSELTTSTSNLYDLEYGSDEELSPAPSLHSSGPSGAPNALTQIGNSGGLILDPDSLQPSKPVGEIKINLSSFQAFGGLTIDLSALQASKPMRQPEVVEDKKILQPEKPVIANVKTFSVADLPFTGKFGESGMYSGWVCEQYKPHGKGTMLYDTGEIIKGYWSEGDLARECYLYSDSENDDDENSDDEEVDLSASMSNVEAKRSTALFGQGRSMSGSKDQNCSAVPSPSPPKSLSPPPPEYKIGDPGKRRDMIHDKDEASLIIEQLGFGDGAFIRRSDKNWTFAIVKSFEETAEGRSAIRFTVNDNNSSKSYLKKYWGTHVRPLKGAKLKPPPSPPEKSVECREGRAKHRKPAEEIFPQTKANNASDEGINREYCCPPPTQSRLGFVVPNRRGRSRSHSRLRSVSASPMRALTSIVEIEAEDENDDEK